jgi:AhpD family alkylhydroperoxidase
MVADDEAKGKVKELFEQLKASTGSVPKWMRVMGNSEDILVGFFMLFKATMDDAPLPKILKWKVAYQVSELNKCEFCVSVSNMQLKTLGLTEEEIATFGEKLDEREQAAMAYALASAACAYKIPEETIANARKHYSDEELVELASVVGLFSFINRFNDSLGVLPDAQ